MLPVLRATILYTPFDVSGNELILALAFIPPSSLAATYAPEGLIRLSTGSIPVVLETISMVIACPILPSNCHISISEVPRNEG